MASDPIETLRTELTTDPLSRGYSSMTATQVITSLNTVNRTQDVTLVDGWQLWAATDLTELGALSAALRSWWIALIPSSRIDVRNTALRAVILSIWGAGTTTRANLVALQTKSVSRAVELELGNVGIHHVNEARA
jgi:hypothetical protein